MKAVSNASPIIFLSKIDTLDLLPQCFDEILIPSAVANELVDYHPPAYIQQIQISPAGSEFVRGAVGRLHTGELEAMVLAQETQADYVILDDLLARRKAQRLGLRIVGTIGILLLAHKIKITFQNRLGRSSVASDQRPPDVFVTFHTCKDYGFTRIAVT